MTRDTRRTGIYVTPLDLTDLLPGVLAEAQKAQPDKGWRYAHTGYDYALGVTPDGTQYVICTEGVGWPLADFVADVYLTQEEHQISLLPSYGLTLDAEEVAKHATGEPVDLSEFIRRFGARLERNFDLWADILTGATA